MLLCPSQPMAEFFLLLFFFPHKSFSTKSKILCLIIDVRKNKHGTKLRTLIWKHGVSRFYHYSIKVELRKKETIEFAKQRSWTFFLKQIGGSWWRESCLKEEKGREERVEKIFRIGEKILGFRFFFFFTEIFGLEIFSLCGYGGYGRFWFLEITGGLWVWWVLIEEFVGMVGMVSLSWVWGRRSDLGLNVGGASRGGVLGCGS